MPPRRRASRARSRSRRCAIRARSTARPGRSPGSARLCWLVSRPARRRQPRPRRPAEPDASASRLRAGERRCISLGWNRPGPSDLSTRARTRSRSGGSWARDLVLPRDRARAGAALRADAEGSPVPADGRDRRRADDLAARGDRRRPQLGLPLLVAARLDLHALRAARGRQARSRRSRGSTGWR